MIQSAEPLFGTTQLASARSQPRGRLIHVFDDDFYVIDDAQALAPFLMSLVSDSDHWLFVASTGGLTAGRGSPATALFPYVTEDKLYDAAGVTGPVTALVASRGGRPALWHPLREADRLVYRITSSLYKNVLGNRLVFEEDNHDLGLCFRAEWRTSDRFGFVRECTLVNQGATAVSVRVLDGLLDLLPADVSEALQLGYSCLVDAYKRHERVPGTTLALYTLAAQVVDRAEPVESLHATVAWSHGLDAPTVLLADDRWAEFERGAELAGADEVRGRRGAYLLQSRIAIAPGGERGWVIVADVARSQAAVAALVAALADPPALIAALRADLDRGRERLERIVAGTDGLQRTADPIAAGHHVANVLFNDLRGGVFAHGSAIPGPDFAAFVRDANRDVWARHRALLAGLPPLAPRAAHQARMEACGDPDLARLTAEYLPLTFSRRHGDPSRPWNRFDIRVKDDRGEQVLDYQGNWRDIFQNWEALACSYPGFLDQLVAKFVNASTVDGHNPYRIARAGIDWEVPEPDHPWATIGYWGDHQIVYLSRLLELSLAHHPDRLPALLEVARFAYADVPYRLRPFADLLADPRVTIDFDAARHAAIVARCARLGSDARLVHDERGVRHVTLVEKLLVPALAKLASFVPGAGIWMNTQRPEWNDANNALVGYGVSMVTACYLERYLGLLSGLLAPLRGRTTPLSREVASWLDASLAALDGERALLEQAAIDDDARWRVMEALGTTAGSYRARVYADGVGEPVATAGDRVLALVALASSFVRHTIAGARRDDGLFHAYSVLVPRGAGRGFGVAPLPEMLEGQVAALSTAALDDQAALAVLDALPTSRLYRPDQRSYLLYPDRRLPGFLAKNVIPAAAVEGTPLLARLVAAGDDRIVLRDVAGRHRFHGSLISAAACAARLRALRDAGELADATDADLDRVLDVYEQVFDHRAFTGRSGTMFAYEGLGSIYWHMVGKLLLATQERFFAAADAGADPAVLARLAGHYEAIRAGMSGVEKSPAVWGAFPLDPYSHTPAHGGARQPGMTGQVKEEILIRLGELGVRVHDGRVAFRPLLLRRRELLAAADVLETWALDGRRLRLELPPGSLAFTCCQVPVIYRLGPHRRLVVTELGGRTVELDGDTLDAERSAALFERTGRIERIEVEVEPGR
jgi:hypothetical protein